jgi:hypothetical protein
LSSAESCIVVSVPEQVRYDDEDEDEGPQPDATLEQGAPIPVRMQGDFPVELASTPLEDIDPFYHNQRVSKLTFMFSKQFKNDFYMKLPGKIRNLMARPKNLQLN